MISCDECQKKMVALFDNEGSEGDDALMSTHLKDCPECRAFREDMVRIRRLKRPEMLVLCFRASCRAFLITFASALRVSLVVPIAKPPLRTTTDRLYVMPDCVKPGLVAGGIKLWAALFLVRQPRAPEGFGGGRFE